jgi:hypothetical protein
MSIPETAFLWKTFSGSPPQRSGVVHEQQATGNSIDGKGVAFGFVGVNIGVKSIVEV